MGNASTESSGVNYALYVKLGSYYVATLIIVGIIGNAVSFVLFSVTRRLKRVPSSQYLAALSLTDLTFVSCLSLIWLKSVGVNWQDSTVVCPVSIFLSNTSCLLSGWYIMALTAEMTLAIVDPYRARRYCSRGLVAKRIISIACFGCLINIWTLIIARSVPVPTLQGGGNDTDRQPCDRLNRSSVFDHCDNPSDARVVNQSRFNSSRPQEPLDSTPIFSRVQEVRLECSFEEEDEEHYNNLTILDSVISFSVPLLVTLTLNITIGFFLLRSLARRQNLVARKFSDNVVATSASALAVGAGVTARRQKSSQLDSTASHERCSQKDSDCKRKKASLPLLLSNSVDGANRKRGGGRTRVTLVSSLLITKSLIYLVLNLPNYVHRLWQMTRTSTTTEDDAHYQSEKLVQLAVYLLFYTQYSLNFFIYSMHACKSACRPRHGSSSPGRRELRAM